MSEQQKPNTLYPLNPNALPQFMPNVIPDPSIRGESFDQILQNRGVRFLHKRAAACPNMTDLYSNSHNPNCTICDGQGILFYQTKEIWGVWSGNSADKQYEMQGSWDVGSSVITFPTEYNDGDQAEFAPLDELVVPDFTIRIQELREYAALPLNKQYMRYPVVNVDFIGSADNDALVTYVAGADFTVSTDGAIEWLVPPPVGTVYSIQYFAHPVYVVMSHVRELRMTQQLINGEKRSKKLPQQIVVKKDYLVNPPSKANT